MATRVRTGFTLIELMIVVVIVGILAAIGVVGFGNAKERGYVAAMKSDLRNLATAQDGYLIDYGGYTTAFTTGDFMPSAGVSGPTIATAAAGWAATVGHTQTDQMCYVFWGTGYSANGPAAAEGQVACQ
jgi:prepilin-type N-terminal cleavage/methylation domain-containing protein